MSKDYIFEPRPVFSSYTPNLFLGSYYIEDDFQADPSMWADPLEDAFVTNSGMKEGKNEDGPEYLNDFAAETVLIGTDELDSLEVIPQAYFWKWDNYDSHLQIPTEISEDNFEFSAYERFLECAAGYDSDDDPYFLLVVDSFMDEGEDVDLWAEEADWTRIQTTKRWWEIYDLWMDHEGVEFLLDKADDDYDWAMSNAGDLQMIGWEMPLPDDDDFYWSMRQAENESHWMTFGRVDYNWATDPDDVELTDEEFWEIDEHIRNEVRYEIDTNNLPGESNISTSDISLSLTEEDEDDFTIYYYWGPAETTGVNSAESFAAEVRRVKIWRCEGCQQLYYLKDDAVGCCYDKKAESFGAENQDMMCCGEPMEFYEAVDGSPDYFYCPVCEVSIITKEFDAESFEAPYTGAGSLMGISGDTDLSSFTSKELTESSAIHGDFDQASLNYSGHQNLEVRAESFSVEETEDGDFWCDSCELEGEHDPTKTDYCPNCGDCIECCGFDVSITRGALSFGMCGLLGCDSCLKTSSDSAYKPHEEFCVICDEQGDVDICEYCHTDANWEDSRYGIRGISYKPSEMKEHEFVPKKTPDFYDRKTGNSNYIHLSRAEEDSPEWDDSDGFDYEAAWENVFEAWMEEWITGGATRTDILKIYAAKNGFWDYEDVDVTKATAWYNGLTIADREDEIMAGDPFNLVGLSSTDSGELQKKVALFESLNEIIEDRMDSWDDQFQSENDYFFKKYGGIYEDGRPCPVCALNNMAENACGTPGNDMCNDCCSKSGGCGHCPVYCPACGNEDVYNLNGLEFSCGKCHHLWNI